MRTLAYPGISTGVTGYPVALAAGVAVSTVRAAVAGAAVLEEVAFCCFSDGALAIYRALLGDAAG